MTEHTYRMADGTVVPLKCATASATPAVEQAERVGVAALDRFADVIAVAEARGAERALREMVAQFDVRGDYLGTQIVDALNAARVANGAVTSIEPGCTCGGVAACEQCQARDYVDADLDPDLPHLLAEARRAHPEGDS